MVSIKDDGVFEVSVDRIWKYIADNRPGVHRHRAIVDTKVMEQKGNVVVQEMEFLNADGRGTHKETWRLTLNPPQGYSVEAIAGPTRGTKFTQVYTPMGEKTRVDVEGDWRVQGLDDVTIRRATLAFLEEAFNEDNAALKKYR